MSPDRPFTLADVGCRWGASDRWREFAQPVHIVGFDADEAECERLNANAAPTTRYVPIALGAEAGEATLYLTQEPGCSSLYEPDPEVLAKHPILDAVMRPVGTTQVELTTLDAWAAENDTTFDAAKLDVQGAELDVLKGAETQLQHLVMLEVEVELNPLYRGQPLFGDVDRFLRARGFELWRLAHLVHYGDNSETIADVQHFDDHATPFDARSGQLYWAHAFYVTTDLTGDRARRRAIAAQGFGL